MLYMLCRNRVADYAAWKRFFDSHAEAHRAAGLVLRQLGRNIDNANDVFFVFECESLDRARAFIDAPEAADASEASGVIDGEYHFVEMSAGYG